MIELPLRPDSASGLSLSELEDQVRAATRWHLSANCRPSRLPAGMDSSWFVPPIEEGNRNPRSWLPKGARAVKVCRGCPVRRLCAQAGQGQVGIWGGVLQARNPWKTSGVSAVDDRDRFRRYLEGTG